MSWGEIHCEHFGTPCPYEPTPASCNQSCKHYESDRRAFGDFYCNKEKKEIQRLRDLLRQANKEEL